MNSRVCTGLALIKQGYTKCRHFSCLSSVNNYGNSQKNQKQNTLYGSVYKVQTRFASEGLVAKIYSPDNPPVAFAMKMLETVHDTTGFPWWGTILLTTVTIRTITIFPFSIYVHKIISKLNLMGPELKERMTGLHYDIAIAKQMYRKAHGKELKVNKRRTERNIKKELYRKHKCHPLKPFSILLVQLPVWFTFSIAIRNLCGGYIPGIGLTPVDLSFLTEGLFWFTNLTLPDTTLILPVILLLTNLTNLEIHPYTKVAPTDIQIYIKNFWRIFFVVISPIPAVVPSCVAFYWTVSSFCALIQNSLLVLPNVRRFFGIPKAPTESETPFKDIFEQKKEIFTRKKI